MYGVTKLDLEQFGKLAVYLLDKDSVPNSEIGLILDWTRQTFGWFYRSRIRTVLEQTEVRNHKYAKVIQESLDTDNFGIKD